MQESYCWANSIPLGFCILDSSNPRPWFQLAAGECYWQRSCRWGTVSLFSGYTDYNTGNWLFGSWLLPLFILVFKLWFVFILTKCVLTIREWNWNQRIRGKKTKIEHSSSYAHVFHTTAKQVISHHGKNENVCEMNKNERCTCKACKTIVFHFQVFKFVMFLVAVVVVVVA